MLRLSELAGQGQAHAVLCICDAATGDFVCAVLGADFIDAQWAICDKEYHEPAMEICRSIQCRHALTKAQLHDALVNVRAFAAAGRCS